MGGQYFRYVIRQEQASLRQAGGSVLLFPPGRLREPDGYVLCDGVPVETLFSLQQESSWVSEPNHAACQDTNAGVSIMPLEVTG